MKCEITDEKFDFDANGVDAEIVKYIGDNGKASYESLFENIRIPGANVGRALNELVKSGYLEAVQGRSNNIYALTESPGRTMYIILKDIEFAYEVSRMREDEQISERQARKMFEKSIELDPHYALAYSSLGYTYTQEWSFGWSQDIKVLAYAFDFAQKAIAQNDSQPGAHALLSEIYLWKKQHADSIAEIKKALAIDPNNADGLAALAGILNWAGKPEDATEFVSRAMDLNPKYPVWYLWNQGHAYYLMGHHEEAIATMRKVIERNPNFLPAYGFLAASYVEINKLEQARTEASELTRLSPYISLEDWKQRLPYRNEEVLVRLFDALRKAGIK